MPWNHCLRVNFLIFLSLTENSTFGAQCKKMDYKVLSRKYRPQKFNEIIGQSHIVDTLINSIASNRLGHGYLFSGSRGVGKTTTARVLAKTLNCLDIEDMQPCNRCQNCLSITESRSLDVIELDGASNRGIDEIREIKETVKYPPISGKFKIYIIDEVHMLTKEAFNALLKTLEEPPNNVVFVLATTDSHKIPETILSRTLRFDFKKISILDITNHISNILKEEKIEYEEPALNLIAKKADGSVRDALSILDRIISYSNNLITYDLVKESLGIIEDEVYLDLLELIIKSDQKSLLIKIKDIIDYGYSIENFIGGFNSFLSNALLYVSGFNKKELLNESVEKWIISNKELINTIDLMRIINELQKFEINSKKLLQPEIALESTFIKLSIMGRAVEISELLSSFKDNTINDDVNLEQIKTKSNNEEVKSIEKKIKPKNQINALKKDKIDLDKIKSNFNTFWEQILENIDNEDKRISSSLYDQKVNYDGSKIEIDLGETDNTYVQKTLEDNIALIEDTILKVLKHKISVVVKAQIKVKEKEQEHPLLDDLKTKFTNSNNS